MSSKGQRREKKLNAKRLRVIAMMNNSGMNVPINASCTELIEIGYKKMERAVPNMNQMTMPRIHAFFDAILKSGKPPRIKGQKKEHNSKVFYLSYEWRKARYSAILANDGRCEACGLSRNDGVVLHVDHIKPLKAHWELRTDPNNLQVLCELCNHGKGNWDSTDWRQKKGRETGSSKSPAPIQ